jgi:hypothetical protein
MTKQEGPPSLQPWREPVALGIVSTRFSWSKTNRGVGEEYAKCAEDHRGRRESWEKSSESTTSRDMFLKAFSKSTSTATVLGDPASKSTSTATQYLTQSIPFCPQSRFFRQMRPFSVCLPHSSLNSDSVDQVVDATQPSPFRPVLLPDYIPPDAKSWFYWQFSIDKSEYS